MRTAVASELSARDRAILRAVGRGRGAFLRGAGTALEVDGRCCCDQTAAHRLVRDGLVAPGPGTGPRVPAVLTPAGERALAG
jgi:hypothetical protein